MSVYIKFLIENKANINIPDNEGETPLHYFAFKMEIDDSDGREVNKYYYSVAQYLLKNGADKNIKDKWGRRAYQYSDGKEVSNIRQLLK